ncbi:SNF2 family N-terminal domain-domain-containing protein [Protomyces lactucae-debilis]|uniref:SNF2 family N-terminal domain-domain-containing protein n=1 Tax=Protomyces lactucae-debilis TaxID=2754530 RepID=A0A1Y2F2R0_PROLT|nr:SNF2 family N-terminal domain-containing protein [Protomyces lactucae-debilis]ORY78180.1 SNF2 family N-terminal domain-domain-containing protein [Protomyces lactucae-debilis]
MRKTRPWMRNLSLDPQRRSLETAGPSLITIGSSPSAPSSPEVYYQDVIDVDAPIDIGSDTEDEDENPQDDDAMNAGNVHIGHLRTRIAGCNHYHGRVTPGEQVKLVRQPQNQYDSNAVQVLNMAAQQVGHLPRGIARGAAPFMDQHVCHLEAAVLGHRQAYSIPLIIDVFAHPSIAEPLKTALARAGLVLIAGDAEARSNKEPARPEQIINLDIPHDAITIDEINAEAIAVNTQSANALLDQLSEKAVDLFKMRKAVQPSRLKTQLLGYQLQGLRWMIEKENPVLPSGATVAQGWKQIRGAYVNIVTQFTTDTPPKLARGGLLSDDMGLGKTLQILSLIAAEAESAPDVYTEFAKGATLLICPTSLMSNWRDQAAEHFKGDSKLKILIYHGTDKPRKKHLERAELVLTTYGTVANEFARKDKMETTGLLDVQWKRIVLDESHKIRNANAQSCKAVTALKSASRWCLSGTPIVNTFNDLAGILRFLRYTGGLEDPKLFNSTLTRKLLSRSPEVRLEAGKLLRIIMQDLSLRRRKDMEVDGKPLVALPPIQEFIHKMPFASKTEEDMYELLQKQAKGLLVDAQGGEFKSGAILEILLRMRQAANCLSLVGENRLAALEALETQDIVNFTPENIKALHTLLQVSVDAADECPICMEVLMAEGRIPQITACKHVFCRDCISETIKNQGTCPLCRAALTLNQLLGLPDCKSEKKTIGKGESTKLSELLKILHASHRKDTTTKTIVFSQWTKFLDLIEPQLKTAGLAFTRIDGTMTVKQRDAAINRLGKDPKTTIMLASLSVASVGLNLVMANQVILCDPWWAPAVEDQSISRVYRLGQKRPVTIYKLVMSDTIEERVLAIQERKREMAKTSGTHETRAQAAQTRRRDIEALLAD